MLSIILTAIGVIALYALPAGIADKPIIVSIWVIFFYLVYDIGTSFYNINLLARTMTNDVGERAKLIIGPRVWVMLLSMIGSAFTAIAVTLYGIFGSYNIAFMILATVATVIASVIAVIGWFMVKERHIVVEEEQQKVSPRISLHCLRKMTLFLLTFARTYSLDLFGQCYLQPRHIILSGACALT